MAEADGVPPPARAPARVSSGYIPGFDGLRAIAVGIVLIAHAGLGEIVPGGFGVTIFFTISGFLITTLLVNEQAATGSIDLRLFYARRVIRLYPELVALMLLCAAAGLWLGWRADLAEVLAGPFYYMNYYHVFGTQYPEALLYPWRHLWSLAIEEHFYLIFPGALALFLRTARSRMRFVVLLIVAPLLWRLVAYHGFELPSLYNYVATEARIDSIAWGCLLALVNAAAASRGRSLAGSSFVNGYTLVLGAILIAASLLYREESFRWTWRFTLQGLGVVLLIANLLFDPRYGAVVRMLEWRPVRYVGRVSYGLYLYHVLINKLILEAWPAIPGHSFLPLSIAMSLAAASLSYQAFEVPLKPLRRRLGSHVR